MSAREQTECFLVRRALAVELAQNAVRPLRRAASQQRERVQPSKPRVARPELDGFLQDIAGEQRLAELKRTLADLLVHLIARSGELAAAPQRGEARGAEEYRGIAVRTILASRVRAPVTCRRLQHVAQRHEHPQRLQSHRPVEGLLGLGERFVGDEARVLFAFIAPRPAVAPALGETLLRPPVVRVLRKNLGEGEQVVAEPHAGGRDRLGFVGGGHLATHERHRDLALAAMAGVPQEVAAVRSDLSNPPADYHRHSLRVKQESFGHYRSALLGS